MRSVYLACVLVLTVVSVAAAQEKSSPGAEKVTPEKALTMGVSHAFAQEQLAWGAVQAEDVGAFNKLVAPPFTYIDSKGITAWDDATSARLKDCTTTDFHTSDVHTQQPESGVVILSYQATMNQTCKGVQSPSPIYVMSIWHRQGASWKLIAHSESHGHAEH